MHFEVKKVGYDTYRVNLTSTNPKIQYLLEYKKEIIVGAASAYFYLKFKR